MRGRDLSGAVERVHATAISFSGRGVLLRGPSGSGKSDLALRCLSLSDNALGAESRLVADDQVILTRDGTTLSATAPQPLLGKFEVRGLGIVDVDPVASARVELVVDLVPSGKVERLPDPWPTCEMLGLLVPLMLLNAFEASAPHKIRLALTMAALPPVRAKD